MERVSPNVSAGAPISLLQMVSFHFRHLVNWHLSINIHDKKGLYRVARLGSQHLDGPQIPANEW